MKRRDKGFGATKILMNDGTINARFYAIQVFLKGYGGQRGEWHSLGQDHFGAPHPDFTASGECWQETRFDGTYRRSTALKALHNISLKWPGYNFRAVERSIVSTTVVIAEQKIISNKEVTLK